MASGECVQGQSTEEMLFGAIAHGNLADHKELLNKLGNVDARGEGRRTLLIEAIRAGKLDWVEALLGLGADISLKGDDGAMGMEAAVQMNAKHPGDGDRQSILKLMQLVHGRESAVRGGEGNAGGDICVRSKPAGQPAVLEELLSTVSRLSREVASLNWVASRRIASASTGGGDVQGDPGSGGSGQDVMTLQLSSLKGTMDELNRGLTSRGLILEDLGNKVGSLSKDWCRMKEGLEAVKAEVQGVAGEVDGLKRSNSEILRDVRPIVEGRLREDCIRDMMGMTEILNLNEGKLAEVRSHYEKIYDLTPMTSTVLKFMRRQSDVKIMIDCDSPFIGNMKSKFVDHDGVERNGGEYHIYSDFAERKVYLGGKHNESNKLEFVVSDLAYLCSQMSIYLIFKNDGLPYAQGDQIHEQQFQKILSDAEVKRKGREEEEVFRWYDWITRETKKAREIYLISAVPGIIVELGLTEGTSRIRQQLESLYTFYQEQVLETQLQILRNE